MSKSTSIHDLPKNNAMPEEESQEAMMVNSILKEIEQEEESLNDENEDSLKYVMDTSQVPPKINNEMPSPEMIKNATEEIFQKIEVLPPVETQEFPEKKEKEEIKKVLEDRVESSPEPIKNNKPAVLQGIDGFMGQIKKKVVGPVLILVLFMILTHTKVNGLMLRILPKLGNMRGEANMLGNFMKGLILAVSYLLVSIFI